MKEQEIRRKQARIILAELNREYEIPSYLEDDALRGIESALRGIERGLLRLEKEGRRQDGENGL